MLSVIISGESKKEKHHGKEENEKAAKGEREFMLSLSLLVEESNVEWWWIKSYNVASKTNWKRVETC